jgi:hypothetical protein
MAENSTTTQLPILTVKNMSPNDYWQTYLATLKTNNANAYSRYLVDSWVINSVDGVMVIGVADQIAVNWLSDRISAPAIRYLNGLSLGEIHQVIFVAAPPPTADLVTLNTRIETEPDIEINIEENIVGDALSDQLPIMLETVAQGIKDVFLKKQAQYVFPRYYFRYLPFIGVGPWWTLNALKQIGYLENTKPITCGDSFQKSQASIAKVIGVSKKTVTRHLNSGILDWFISADKTPKHKMVAGKVQKEAITYTFHSVIPPTPSDQDALKGWLFDNGIHQDPIKTLKQLLSEEIGVFDVLPKNPLPPTNEQKHRAPFPITFANLIFSCVKPSQNSKSDLVEIKKLADLAGAKIEKSFGLVNIPIYFMCHAIETLGPIGSLAIVMLRRLTFRNEEEVRLTGTLQGGRMGLAKQIGISDLSLKRYMVVGENNLQQRKPNSTNLATLKTRDKVSQLRKTFGKYVQFQPKEDSRPNVSATDNLKFTIAPEEPLLASHQLEYDAAIQIISTFVKATNRTYTDENIDTFLNYLVEKGLFANQVIEVNNVPYDKDNIVTIDEVNNILIGEVNRVPIGKVNNIPIEDNNIVPISEVNFVPNGQVNNGHIKEVNNVTIFKYFKYLTINHLKDELLNLTTIYRNTKLSNNNQQSNGYSDLNITSDDDWNQLLILNKSSLSKNQIKQVSEYTHTTEELVAWILYAYLPENKVNNVWAFVLSQIRENKSGAYFGKIKQLIKIGPQKTGKLISRMIKNKENKYSDDVDPLRYEWQLIKSLFATKLDEFTLLELAEQIGVIDYR